MQTLTNRIFVTQHRLQARVTSEGNLIESLGCLCGMVIEKVSFVHYRYPAIYVVCQNPSDILQSTHSHIFSSCIMRFVYNLLNNEAIILLNLAEYRLASASSAKCQATFRAAPRNFAGSLHEGNPYHFFVTSEVLKLC